MSNSCQHLHVNTTISFTLVDHGVSSHHSKSRYSHIQNMFSHLLLSYTTVPCCSMWGDTVCLTDLQLTNKTLNTHTHARTHTGTQEGNSHLYANRIVSLTVSFRDLKCACENSFSHGREVHKHDGEINVACALCSHKTNGS